MVSALVLNMDVDVVFISDPDTSGGFRSDAIKATSPKFETHIGIAPIVVPLVFGVGLLAGRYCLPRLLPSSVMDSLEELLLGLIRPLLLYLSTFDCSPQFPILNAFISHETNGSH